MRLIRLPDSMKTKQEGAEGWEGAALVELVQTHAKRRHKVLLKTHGSSFPEVVFLRRICPSVFFRLTQGADTRYEVVLWFSS